MTEQEKLDLIEEVVSKFIYKRDTVFRLWRDVRNGDSYEGNCQDFAWTIAKIWFGNTFKVIIAMITLKVIFYRARSPQNYWFWPRHAVLWVSDLGYIDSTKKEWRSKAVPHKLWYPIGLPFVVIVIWWLL